MARITRSSPAPGSPRSERKAAASAGSSSAISSSIRAHTESARTPGRSRKPSRPAVRRASPAATAASASSLFSTSSSGLAERNWKPRNSLAAARSKSSARSGVPASRASTERRRSASSASWSFASPFRRSFSMRSMRRSATARSARMSSSSMARTSRAGSIVSAGCGTVSSRKARTTCSRAFAVRYGATSTRAAPVVGRAAMSTNVTVAGVRLRGEYSSASRSRRGSGTSAGPTLASWRAACPPAARGRVRSWNKVVLPAEATPIRPARNMLDECRTSLRRGPRRVRLRCTSRRAAAVTQTHVDKRPAGSLRLRWTKLEPGGEIGCSGAASPPKSMTRGG